MQWSCRDANVRHTGQNLRKTHTFVASAIFTTALTMLALSEMLLSNDPLGYADLILNGDPEKYLRNVAESHGLED